MSQHLICEAWHDAHATERLGRRDGRYHLRENEQSGRTLCEKLVANGTYIPVAAFGVEQGDGIAWCRSCERRGGPVIAAAKEADLIAQAQGTLVS